MNDNERIADIQEIGIFNNEELEHSGGKNHPHTFKSWEFGQILHYTNAELHYLDGEIQGNLEMLCDSQHMTTKGIIYCFN